MKNNSLYSIRQEFLNFFKNENHKYIKSSSLIPHNDNSLLFTNAGMVQFKNIFLGLEHQDYKKAVTAQKCLRAGGKHNDLDNVGYTARHHTFFEMLGNFSFGDYFKEQAILYAYNFITKSLGINKDKLLVTVYSEDNESYDLWKKIAGFTDNKIIKISTNDNFWSMGDTGPCGPCTEIFYDLGSSVAGGPPGSKDEDGDRFTEIWNIVFMQYNQLANGTKNNLTVPCVDTGMGLERIVAVMQGVLDNYDIDLFNSIISQTEEILKVKLTNSNKPSFKVIADHIRASTFLISDGVRPSNEGRGYVLRRIIRRAIRHGYLLGNKEPVFYKLVSLITNLMKDPYTELENSEILASKTIYSEEEKFNKTIEDGMKLLFQSKNLVKNNMLQGSVAFKLYDTYGFPLDLTETILKKDNIAVNIEEFYEHMKQQKELSKKNWIGSGEIKDSDYWFTIKEKINTKFIGYDNLICKSEAKVIVDYNFIEKDSLSKGEEGYVIFPTTTFYPEGGGQVGDKGIVVGDTSLLNKDINNIANNNDTAEYWKQYKKLYLEHNNLEEKPLNIQPIETQVNNSDISSNAGNKNYLLAEVTDTLKVAKDLIIHKVRVLNGKLTLSSNNLLIVNSLLRKSASSNHTATHILFAALRKALGYDVAQQGSLVTPNRLRADVYVNSALTKDQLKLIEEEANNIILNNLPIKIEYMPYKEAISKGVNFLMGEEYPEIVRVVSIIGKNCSIISNELCGGCHVKNTGEIGIFKIISESGIRAGVRRIEVVTGKSALRSFQTLEDEMRYICNLLKGNNITVVINKIENLLIGNKDLKEKVNNLENAALLLKVQQGLQVINKVNFIEINLNLASFLQIKGIVSSIVNKYTPALLVVISEKEENMSFIIAKSKDVGLNLNAILKELKSLFNINGGGKENLIQGSVDYKNKAEFIRLIKEKLK